MKKLSLCIIAVMAISIAMLFMSSSPTTQRSTSTAQRTASPAQHNSSPVPTNNAEDKFEKAVELIKKYETLHKPKHWPLVGYGHKVLPGEKYSRTKALSESEADALLRKDLLKNCAVFRQYGADSLILGVLAYNIGSGNVLRSSVVRKLKSGDRNIRANYISHCKYRGQEHKQIKLRRIEEFDELFITELED